MTFEDIQKLEDELERLKRTEQDLQDYSLGCRPEREQEKELQRLIENEEKLIDASNRETEEARQALIQSMTELTTLRVYQALVNLEKDLPANRKEEAVKQVEEMLTSQKALAKRESQQKTQLLKTE